MKKCSYCGGENEDAAIACSGCSTEFESLDDKSAVPEGTKISPAMSPPLVNRIFALIGALIFLSGCIGAGNTFFCLSRTHQELQE